jgi:hypothetical protein
MGNLSFYFIAILTFTIVQGKGNFKSYNNEDREKFVQEHYQGRSDLNSQPIHEKVKTKLANNTKQGPRYDPTWESLDSRPLPTWYDQSKIGIFIHWVN